MLPAPTLLTTPASFLSVGKIIVSYLAAFSVVSSSLFTSSSFDAVLQRSAQASKLQQYDSFSATYDKLNSGTLTSSLGIDDMRRQAAKFVTGDVLEVAVGTGLQSQYYDWLKVKSFAGVDSSEGMLDEARNRIPFLASKGGSAVSIELLKMNTNQLEFEDNKVPKLSFSSVGELSRNFFILKL
jgi:ubiquinone/menaquinone biosynthesis C-methylase UbiE